MASVSIAAVHMATAADVTVTGGNWSDFGVASGDSVTVSGTSANDVSGLTLGSLAFTATASVSGEKVILNGGAAAFSVASGATVTSTLPIELASGDQTLTIAGMLAQSGVISGAGLLNKKGTGTLELRATNTYTGGTRLWRENGTAAGYIHVYADNALGTGMTTIGAMNFKDTMLHLYNEVSLDNDFTLDTANNTWSRGSPHGWGWVFTGGVTINGDVTYTNSMYVVGTGTTAKYITFNGNVIAKAGTQGANHLRQYMVDSVPGVIYKKKVSVTSNLYQQDTDRVTEVQLWSSDNVLPGVYINKNNFILCQAENVISNTIVKFAGDVGNDYVNLNGFDQLAKGAYTEKTLSTGCSIRTPAGKPARFTMNDDSSRNFAGVFEGPLTVVWNPSTAKTFTHAGSRASTMTGDLIVSNGTYALEASFSQLTALHVAEGATFKLVGSGEIAGVTTRLYLANGATFDVPAGVTASFERLYVAGEALTRGVSYISEETEYVPVGKVVRLAQIKGDGVVFVPGSESATTATWTGGAGANTSVQADANWEGGEAPSFDALNDVKAVFATGGERAAFDTAVQWAGVSLQMPTGKTAFTLTDGGSASLTVGAMGVTAADAATAGAKESYVIEPPVTIASSAAIAVGTTDTNLCLTLAGPLGYTLPAIVRKTGAGTLRLSGDNTFSGPFQVTEGKVEFLGANAFGADCDQPIVIKQETSAGLVVSNATARRPVTGEVVTDYPVRIRALPGTTNVFEKPLSFVDRGIIRAENDSEITFAGGITNTFSSTANRLRFYMGYRSRIVIRDVPFKLSGGPLEILGDGNPAPYFGSSCTVSVEVAQNILWRSTWDTGLFLNNATLRTPVPYAFTSGEQPKHGSALGYGSCVRFEAAATWDLCGCDQWIGGMSYDDNSRVGNFRFTSDEPAMLYWEQERRNLNDNVPTNNQYFVKQVGLSKLGPWPMVLTKDQTTTGPLEVTEGDLVFGPNAGWACATNYVVCTRADAEASARLVLSKANLNPKGTLKLGADARIDIPAGTVQKVKALRLEVSPGVWRTVGGTWGRLGHPTAANKTASITGDGLIHSSFSGMCIFVK